MKEWPAASRLRARDRVRKARRTAQARRQRRAGPLAPLTVRRAAARPAPLADHRAQKRPRRPAVAAALRAQATAPPVRAGLVGSVALRRARARMAWSAQSRLLQAKPVDPRLPSEPPPPRESPAPSR